MELRVPDDRKPDDVEERWKETLTLLFLLLTRRRRPMRACCARRSLEMCGLSGFLRTSCAALVDGLTCWGPEEGGGAC